MTAATRARAAALSCEGKKDGLRQTQEGLWKVTFTVSPLDMPQSLMAARPGTRYMLALVEIGDDEQPILSGPSPASHPPMAAAAPAPEPQTPAKETDGRRSTSQAPVVQRCAILCGDRQFQRWLWLREGRSEARFNALTLTEADLDTAATLRAVLCVQSRRDLAIDNAARDLWLALEGQYMTETGQRPWRRPDDRRSA